MRFDPTSPGGDGHDSTSSRGAGAVLTALGWGAGFARSYARFDRPDQWPARVIRVDLGVCTVLGAGGARRASLGGGLLAAAAADQTRLPGTGDWVVGRDWPDERTTIEAVLPRRTAVIQAGVGAAAVPQVLVANVDVVAVVEPLDPRPDLGRIERLLTLAGDSGALPIIILTKADLATDPDTIASEIAELAPGVAVYPVNAGDRGSVAIRALRQLVPVGQTLGLIGASGAGKSTLVNALVGTTVMETRGLRRADGRGRRPTTYRALILLPDGGAVIDTPGMRAVGLVDGVDRIDQTFADIDALAKSCRFVDCAHLAEPGCAVVTAVAMGEVSPRRVMSWRELSREVSVAAGRRDARLVAQERFRRRGRYHQHRTFRA